MTAYTELGLRERAKAHDISDPSASLTGQDVAERALLRRVYHVPTLAETGTGDAIGEKPVVSAPAAQFPNGAKVVEISFRSDTAITTHATAHFTDTFTSRDSAGINNLTTATITSDSDVAVAAGGLLGSVASTVAHKRYVAFLSATLANRVIPAGGCLTLTRVKAGGGVQLPDCNYDITLEAL